MSENKPKVALRDWAPFIRNSYQKKVNPEETGIGDEPIKNIIDKKGSSDKHKEYVIDLFNKYLAALGVCEFSFCFKGGKDKKGETILKSSYAFFEEDKELVVGLLNAEEKEQKKHISKGEFDKCRIEILEDVIQKMQRLFEKYYPNKTELGYINQIMKNITRVDVFRQIEVLKSQIMKIDKSMAVPEDIDVYQSAGFRVGAEDYICWSNFLCNVLERAVEKCMDIYTKMGEYREDEFDKKLVSLPEEKQEILNQYITSISQELHMIGIETNPEQQPYISNSKDVKAAKKKEQIKGIFEKSSGEEGEKLFNDLVSTESSEEVLKNVVCKTKNDETNDETDNGIIDDIDDKIEDMVNDMMIDILLGMGF